MRQHRCYERKVPQNYMPMQWCVIRDLKNSVLLSVNRSNTMWSTDSQIFYFFYYGISN